MTEKNGSGDSKSDSDSKSRDQNPHSDTQNSAANAHKSPKKRRKVNHACVYCRRSHMTCDLERPCTRCIKRNIGHLCHDEPRDPDSKKPKSVQGTSVMDESDTRSEVARSTMGSLDQHRTRSAFGATALTQGGPLQLVQPTPATGIQAGALNNNLNQFTGFNEAWLNNPFHEMHNYHTNYMIPEVTHEFNLLNDFLQSSLLDDGVLSPGDSSQILKTTVDSNEMNSGGYFPAGANTGNNSNNTMLPPGAIPSSLAPSRNPEHGASITRPVSVVPVDKAKEYYMEAADPHSNEGPDDRMERVLRAKYEAGMLKPFNYTKGYSRLLKYLDGHIAPASKQKILRQLDRFRPKFREKVEKLTDVNLIMVEMWFEKTLMEYDRVFASMAVPACCWRRTGEIFRGNKEMAELINVPVDRLRDGDISLHEILTEESLVRYWEEFGTIAFDPDHESLLTASALKNPDEDKAPKVVNCCFSFMIRRDQYNLPSLIVGNFLPHDP